MRVAIIIPARYGSSRFPGKPLATILDKPMIQWVVEAARKSRFDCRVIVATDDERILGAVQAFGGEALMTDPHHPSGTDRIAEAARGLDLDVVVNLQGDEPTVSAKVIDSVIEALGESGSMSTACSKLGSDSEMNDPNVVKVTVDENGLAKKFSREPLSGAFRHLGIYGYNARFLQEFTSWSPSESEKKLRLEQMRAMDAGIGIRTVKVNHQVLGVDVPEDIELAERVLRESGVEEAKASV